MHTLSRGVFSLPSRFSSKLTSFTPKRTVFVPLNAQVSPWHTNLLPPKKKEITIYIKGFLAKGETPEEFGHWFKCHQQLSVGAHGWGSTAHGYFWKAGHASWDKYLPYGTLLYSAVNLVTKRRIPFTPIGVAGIVASEVALVGGRLWYEFRKAHETACEYAPTLAQNLIELKKNYDKIRCVAHSLGCVLLLESIKSMPQSCRPQEVHLLAPAFTEDHLMDDIAQEQTYLYHCDRDLILGAASTLRFVEGDTVGYSGPKKLWKGLTPIDVSPHLGFFVHREYRDVLHKIAADHNSFVTGTNQPEVQPTCDIGGVGISMPISDNMTIEKIEKAHKLDKEAVHKTIL